MKIAIYAIAKNEGKHVYRWYESVKEADSIYVVDTGSTDDTVRKLQNCGVNVFSVPFPNFRFDVARQTAMSLVPTDHFAVWLDMDETLEVGWYKKLQDILESGISGITGVNFRLVFTQNADNTPAITYDRLSGHVMGAGYYWKYHAHELLMSEREGVHINTDIKCYHLPDLDKPRNYLPLLEDSYWHYRDARATRYYARELMYHGQAGKAISIYLQAAELEQSNHVLCEIYHELASCYETQGLMEEALDAFKYSAWACPDMREGWSKFAMFCWRRGDIYGCISACIQMQYITDMPDNGIIRQEDLYNEWPDHMLALCHSNLGNESLARTHIERAFKLAPNNIAVVSDMISICNIPITQS